MEQAVSARSRLFGIRLTSPGRYFLVVMLFSITLVSILAARQAEASTATIWPTPNFRQADSVFLFGDSLYYSEQDHNRIGRLNVATGEFTEWTVLTSDSEPGDIVVAQDGLVYFYEYSTDSIGRLNPSTGEFSEWMFGSVPASILPIGGGEVMSIPTGGAVLVSQAGDTCGARPSIAMNSNWVYFTAPSANAIGGLNTGTGEFARWTLPTSEAGPGDIFVADDGFVYFVEYCTENIGRLNPSNGEFVEWTFFSSVTERVIMPGVPVLAASVPMSGGVGVMALAPPTGGGVAGKVGISVKDEWVYYTSPARNLILGLDTATGKFTAWPVPTSDSQPGDVFVAEDGFVYFIEYNAQKIGRLDPEYGVFNEWTCGLGGSLYTPTDIFVSGSFVFFAADGGIVRLDIEPVETVTVGQLPATSYISTASSLTTSMTNYVTSAVSSTTSRASSQTLISDTLTVARSRFVEQETVTSYVSTTEMITSLSTTTEVSVSSTTQTSTATSTETSVSTEYVPTTSYVSTTETNTLTTTEYVPSTVTSVSTTVRTVPTRTQTVTTRTQTAITWTWIRTVVTRTTTKPTVTTTVTRNPAVQPASFGVTLPLSFSGLLGMLVAMSVVLGIILPSRVKRKDIESRSPV